MNMNIAPFMGVAMAVILVVFGLVFGEEIINNAGKQLGNSYVSGNTFIGLSIVIKSLPTLYYVGLFGLAGAIGFISGRQVVTGWKGKG